ncbi:hypothetical protein GGQ86_002258 [Xanthobacter flavus]|uniref:Uncharacterized protein n=2 Tax=Xanthobacter flavus TaxID=281 RepID=A0A9W6FHE8_XANFL|nr:hypothetical protein [Xanthobacter flavus]MDR6333788.1 hypothetical protein [Xanthobacter flavus]GLI20459.1 hypothetical protein XFLAVUS301_01330 [Xanthobacter flavus]
MKWDKGNTPIMPRIVPGTMIRILPPWQKTGQKRANPLRGPTLRVIETERPEAAPVAPEKKP